MKTHGLKRISTKCHIQQIWLDILVASCASLMRSLKSSNKEALMELLLCEDYNDPTSPTSNQIPDIHIAAVYVVYDTF